MFGYASSAVCRFITAVEFVDELEYVKLKIVIASYKSSVLHKTRFVCMVFLSFGQLMCHVRVYYKFAVRLAVQIMGFIWVVGSAYDALAQCINESKDSVYLGWSVVLDDVEDKFGDKVGIEKILKGMFINDHSGVISLVAVEGREVSAVNDPAVKLVLWQMVPFLLILDPPEKRKTSSMTSMGGKTVIMNDSGLYDIEARTGETLEFSLRQQGTQNLNHIFYYPQHLFDDELFELEDNDVVKSNLFMSSMGDGNKYHVSELDVVFNTISDINVLSRYDNKVVEKVVETYLMKQVCSFEQAYEEVFGEPPVFVDDKPGSDVVFE